MRKMLLAKAAGLIPNFHGGLKPRNKIYKDQLSPTSVNTTNECLFDTEDNNDNSTILLYKPKFFRSYQK